MLFNFATLALPLVLLGRVALANPLDTRAADLKVADKKVTHCPDTNVVNVESAKPPAAKFAGQTTSANTGFEALASADDRDQFVVCDDLNCQVGCRAVYLFNLSGGICYHFVPNSSFWSTYIYQPSNTGLPYAFYVGTQNCADPARLPAVNTCYYSTVERNTFFRTF